jgi:hypothetical protein
VEHIQALIKEGKKPAKVIETPVYEYAWTMPNMLMDRDSENTYKFTQKQRPHMLFLLIDY